MFVNGFKKLFLELTAFLMSGSIKNSTDSRSLDDDARSILDRRTEYNRTEHEVRCLFRETLKARGRIGRAQIQFAW